MKSLYDQAKDTLNVCNTTMLYKARDAFTDLVHSIARNAVEIAGKQSFLDTLGKHATAATIGAESRQQAVRKCIQEFNEKGIDRSMKVYKYGANVDTDVIIPARHLNDPSPAALASHCMEDIDPDFASTVEAGDIVVAGPNFGCGSSREHAPLALKSCGVKCVIAPSFARIFYRNAINIGFPIVECAQAAQEIQAGDQVDVDFSTGVITDTTQGKTWQAAPFPEFIDGIIKSGGLLNSLKARGVAK